MNVGSIVKRQNARERQRETAARQSSRGSRKRPDARNGHRNLKNQSCNINIFNFPARSATSISNVLSNSIRAFSSGSILKNPTSSLFFFYKQPKKFFPKGSFEQKQGILIQNRAGKTRPYPLVIQIYYFFCRKARSVKAAVGDVKTSPREYQVPRELPCASAVPVNFYC